MQVNSLGLTESQPENNIIRIVLEALAVTMGRSARARALQLPAWNEALGLPRPWDQQWSLRIQQILAYETDLLDYPDIFEGSRVMDGLVEELVEGARAEMAVVAERGGAVAAVPYMKTQLVESHRERVRRIETGEQAVVGQNVFTEAEPSPLQEGEDGGILRVDPAVEAGAIDGRQRVARRSATRPPSTPRWTRCARPPPRTRTSCPPTLAAARGGRDHGRVGGGAALGLRRVPGADRRRRRRRGALRRRARPRCATASSGSARRSAGG